MVHLACLQTSVGPSTQCSYPDPAPAACRSALGGCESAYGVEGGAANGRHNATPTLLLLLAGLIWRPANRRRAWGQGLCKRW
eukprot:1160585-Pelagomonas_calceolata.AAC.5